MEALTDCCDSKILKHDIFVTNIYNAWDTGALAVEFENNKMLWRRAWKNPVGSFDPAGFLYRSVCGEEDEALHDEKFTEYVGQHDEEVGL